MKVVKFLGQIGSHGSAFYPSGSTVAMHPLITPGSATEGCRYFVGVYEFGGILFTGVCDLMMIVLVFFIRDCMGGI